MVFREIFEEQHSTNFNKIRNNHLNASLPSRYRPSQGPDLLGHRLHLTADHLGQPWGNCFILPGLVFQFGGGRERAATCSQRRCRVHCDLWSAARHWVHREGHRSAWWHLQHAAGRDTSYRYGKNYWFASFSVNVTSTISVSPSFYSLSSAQPSRHPPTSSSLRSLPPLSLCAGLGRVRETDWLAWRASRATASWSTPKTSPVPPRRWTWPQTPHRHTSLVWWWVCSQCIISSVVNNG